MSKRAAYDARALRTDDLRPRRIDGASWSQIRCLNGRSVRRWCERVANPKTAARTATPATQSMLSLLPCPRWSPMIRYFPPFPGFLAAKSLHFLLTSVHYCPELPGISRLLFIACLLTIARHCAVLRGIARLKILPLSKCPRTVRRSRSASRRAPFAAAPVALRAASAATNAKGTHAEKGECSILHEQGNFPYCVDKREELVAAG